MSFWIKLSDSWCYHPKAVAAGAAACGVWSRLLSYSGRARSAKIPAAEALILAWQDQTHLDHLEAVGLLTREGVYYVLHEWEQYQKEIVNYGVQQREAGKASGRARREKKKTNDNERKRTAVPERSISFDSVGVPFRTESTASCKPAPIAELGAEPRSSIEREITNLPVGSEVNGFPPYGSEGLVELLFGEWPGPSEPKFSEKFPKAKEYFEKHINASNYLAFVRAYSLRLKQYQNGEISRHALGAFWYLCESGWRDVKVSAPERIQPQKQQPQRPRVELAPLPEV